MNVHLTLTNRIHACVCVDRSSVWLDGACSLWYVARADRLSIAARGKKFRLSEI